MKFKFPNDVTLTMIHLNSVVLFDFSGVFLYIRHQLTTFLYSKYRTLEPKRNCGFKGDGVRPQEYVIITKEDM